MNVFDNFPMSVGHANAVFIGNIIQDVTSGVKACDPIERVLL